MRILLISVALFFGTSALAADCGVFKVVKGDVKYKKKSRDQFKKARKNKKVCQGDTIKTAGDGRAKIEMADKNEINISPRTELIIETYLKGQKAVLNVIDGKVRSDVKQKYEDTKQSHYRVKTKSAVAGVRGTEFLASYNAQKNQTRIVTFEGKVAVGQLKGDNFVPKVEVKSGQYTSNTPGTEPHAPKEVPPTELAQLDRESQVGPPANDKAPASTNDQPKNKRNEEPKQDQQQEPTADEDSNERGPGSDEPQKGNNGNDPQSNGVNGDKVDPADDNAKENRSVGAPPAKSPRAGVPVVGGPEADTGHSDPKGGSAPMEPKGNYGGGNQYGDRNFEPAVGGGADARIDVGAIESQDPGFDLDAGTDRDPASIDLGGNLSGELPPPDLTEGPALNEVIQEPEISVVQQPEFIPPGAEITDNNQIQDGVISTTDRANVTIEICLPGRCK